ncbi:putative quinol monooxygenase [Aurantiacibacter sp. MUD61]|uniref:putative quinol monooxygenase n=1 Tax=Aurantiacibacter sp. MUD61 TaxID=3009083 RepID=UPI0022F0FB8D|nr:putative quinol monooxygenase [Aurantiacibacter sp. MUD61]
MIERREFIGAAAIGLLGACTTFETGMSEMEEAYGVIGQMMTASGKRAEVIAALLAGTRDMPGNIAYLIAEDLADPNAIWITEVWRTRTDHENSLQLPQVQAAIAAARPHIAGFGTRAETRPITRA